MRLPSVLVDASVLYSSTLRGWFLNLAETGALTLHSTEDVIAEAVARWRDDNPEAQGVVTTRMAQNIRMLAVVIEEFDPSLPFPYADGGDRHVHAACLAGRVEYLVTEDRGFLDTPTDVKDGLPYEIYRADEFLVLAHNQNPSQIRELTRKEIERRVKKGEEPRVAQALRDAGAPEFSSLVARHARNLAGAGRPVLATSTAPASPLSQQPEQ